MSQTTTSTRTLSRSTRRLPGSSPTKSGAGNITTASTPNLNALYSAHHTTATSRLPPPTLSRKGSLAALTLTQNSLAAIPDETETFSLDRLNLNSNYKLNSSSNNITSPDSLSPFNMAPLTPGKLSVAGSDGAVAVGDQVEVPGNMHGTVRFVGSVAGRKGVFAGVELNQDFASRGKNNGDVDGVQYFTTTAPGAGIFLPLSKAVKRTSNPSFSTSFPKTPTGLGLKVANQNSTNHTPPTPSLPKFSQSVGPGRAASPLGRKTRTSLPRPDSPVRRLQMTPAARPSIATPAPKVGARFGSPNSNNKFSQSVRAPPGDPSKKGLGFGGAQRKGSIGPRSASALGGAASGMTDDETTPVGVKRTKTNGSVGSTSSFGAKLRSGSRAGNHDDEVLRLKAELEDRDKQLKDQASTLAEMETSLTELQTLIEDPDGPLPRRGSVDDKDVSQLRAVLREKNDKIAMLTAEFDAHRADFRITIDTLEMASTETERVYEKKMEELMQEIHELENRGSDVDTVAQQLKQLEELVQELEEGLEDARRGEAEARGEVEFLRGEVERTRSELRREREKAQAATNGGAPNGERSTASKDLEQKDDEIRGLKAIIHSLSRDAPGDSADKASTRFSHRRNESHGDRAAREKLEREVADLRAQLDKKNTREDEMEREIDHLRRGSTSTSNGAAHRGSAMTIGSNNRSSLRDSRGTVVLDREYQGQHPVEPLRKGPHHSRGLTLESMPENSDAYSSVTESSTLWCEICETNGHDILTCTNMFGPQQDQATPLAEPAAKVLPEAAKPPVPAKDTHLDMEDAKPAPLSPVKSKAAAATVPPEVKIIPNPMESGPVAGKESGTIDAEKWCALCERDGHDSVDCPFEDAF